MGNNKLKGKDLRRINFKSNISIAMAIDIMAKHYKHQPKDEKIRILEQLVEKPEQYKEHEYLNTLSACLAPDMEEECLMEEIKLLDNPRPYTTHGRRLITDNTMEQMDLAMSLPVVNSGALMPDAHHGYGLPIGGVLATENAVIPYGVGLDIGCRMSLTIYDVNTSFLTKNAYKIKLALKSRTNFGTGGTLNINQEHEVLDNEAFQSTSLLRQLHGKAARQLGTSGSGNHFVEFGIVTLDKDNDIGMIAGDNVGLLAHSGSRGLGATIAQHYTDIAIQNCYLPKKVQHMAWLDLNSDAGQAYWMSMNLAGDYAKACHDQIHHNLAKYLGLTPVKKIENHHNFAWKEVHQGKELIVHRKGATPASKGTLGIIPGSMTANGYIVRGKGNISSLHSASHGAGRRLSRNKAKMTYTGSEMKKVLKRENVTLIGGGIDEAPIAYKDIEQVMLCQKDLVDVIGKFQPRIVRMDKK